MDNKRIKNLIIEHGFDRAVCLRHDILTERWSKMLQSRPELRLSLSPRDVLKGAESTLLLVLRYAPVRGYIPGYYIASNSGYHRAVALARELSEAGHAAKLYHPPLKPLALEAGLGMMRKNSLIYMPGLGSRVVLYALAFEHQAVNLDYAEVEQAEADPCGECDICSLACPMGAIDKHDGLEPHKCIRNYLESGDMTDLVERSMTSLFGCEICQSVCPHNLFIPEREPTDEERASFDLHAILQGRTDGVKKLVGKNMLTKGRLAAQAQVLIKRGIHMI